MLDKSATREALIIAALATGGFREGTFSKLKYRHVKEDLEANRIPNTSMSKRKSQKENTRTTTPS